MRLTIFTLIVSQVIVISLLSELIPAQLNPNHPFRSDNSTVLANDKDTQSSFIFENANFTEECKEVIRCIIDSKENKNCTESKENFSLWCQLKSDTATISEEDQQNNDFICSCSIAKCLSAATIAQTLSVKDCKDLHSKCKDSHSALKFDTFCKQFSSIVEANKGLSPSALYQDAGCDLNNMLLLPIAPPLFEGY